MFTPAVIHQSLTSCALMWPVCRENTQSTSPNPSCDLLHLPFPVPKFPHITYTSVRDTPDCIHSFFHIVSHFWGLRFRYLTSDFTEHDHSSNWRRRRRRRKSVCLPISWAAVRGQPVWGAACVSLNIQEQLFSCARSFGKTFRQREGDWELYSEWEGWVEVAGKRKSQRRS